VHAPPPPTHTHTHSHAHLPTPPYTHVLHGAGYVGGWGISRAGAARCTLRPALCLRAGVPNGLGVHLALHRFLGTGPVFGLLACAVGVLLSIVCVVLDAVRPPECVETAVGFGPHDLHSHLSRLEKPPAAGRKAAAERSQPDTLY
jgi:hypothetical protein